jgi:glycosyltransferase involved in cell wall biosynthesis
VGNLVSVIVPTYNRVNSLGRAVTSALHQTHHEVEAIVVDDGSTDGTREFILKNLAGDRRVNYIYQGNQGVAAARNQALRAAQGDFIAFLDSDDVWKPWKLELQLACMRRLPHIGMIWSDMEALAPDGAVASRYYLRKMYAGNYRWWGDELFIERHPAPMVAGEPAFANATLYAGDIFSQMVMGNLVHTSTVLLTRDRLNRVGYFDEALRRGGEDYDFHLRTCREGPVGFIDVETIGYQIDMPDQLVRQSYWMARNFLTTVTTTLERDKDRIMLPPRLVNEVLAHANSWVGETLIPGGELRSARGHFWRSLRRKPWQPRVAAQLILCALPPSFAERARRAYRELKRLRLLWER